MLEYNPPAGFRSLYLGLLASPVPSAIGSIRTPNPGSSMTLAFSSPTANPSCTVRCPFRQAQRGQVPPRQEKDVAMLDTNHNEVTRHAPYITQQRHQNPDESP